MAGNQTDARRRAEQELEDARRSGADSHTLGKLQAQVNVARNAENAATGSSGQARTPFGF